jgi:hypothetical protein
VTVPGVAEFVGFEVIGGCDLRSVAGEDRGVGAVCVASLIADGWRWCRFAYIRVGGVERKRVDDGGEFAL